MRTLQTDVAIVGAGAAGIPAAIEAAQAGAKVDVFEQDSRTGGPCNGGNGVFAVESKMQRLKQFTYTKEEILRYWMNYTHNNVDARLVSEFINRSADTVDWMESMGVDFSDLIAYYPGAKYVWHFRRDGSEFITDLMRPVSEKAGAVYHTNTMVTKLTMDGKKCVGFIAKDKDGEIEVKAKAVILATGGTGKKASFVKQETGWQLGEEGDDVDISVFPHYCYEDEEKAPKLGVELGWEVGAMHTKLMIDSFASIPAPNFGPGGVPAQLPWFRQPQNICVNYHGERFIDEAEMRNGAFMGNAIAIQKKQTGFMIFTQEMRNHYDNVGMDYEMGNVHFMDDLSADEYLERNWNNGNTDIMVYNTLEELADGMGIDCEGLLRTVAEYNENIKAMKGDPIFHKDVKYLVPIEGTRYYVARFKRHAYAVLGGMRINYRAELLDTEMDPIPGLYGAGNDVNCVYTDTYPFDISGNTSSFAINTGRIAGQQAAKFALNV